MSEHWDRWIQTLPKDLAKEFIDERPCPDQEDIDIFTKLRLTNKTPIKVSIDYLLNKSWMQGTVSRTPQSVVDAINNRYGTNFKGGIVYEKNPDRLVQYAKMPMETANPSVMANDEIIFGVGRLIAAMLRGDPYIKVWSLKETKKNLDYMI